MANKEEIRKIMEFHYNHPEISRCGDSDCCGGSQYAECYDCKKEFAHLRFTTDCPLLTHEEKEKLKESNEEFKLCVDPAGILDKTKCQDCKNRQPQDDFKKYGTDYLTLKPIQQEGRKKTVSSWQKNTQQTDYYRKKVCRYCPKEFEWDKSSDYLPARTKAQQELDNHQNSCSKKNNQTQQKKLKQQEWDKVRKSKERRIYECKKGCWGKVCLDKKIVDWEQAKKQAWADLIYHQKNECGKTGKKKIAIYHSPNQGGNEHADLSLASEINENELFLEMDNQGEVYTEQENKTNYIPWILGGIGIVGVTMGLVWLVRRNKSKKIRE